jgi:multidrug transporter EmrE-like cation transporter
MGLFDYNHKPGGLMKNILLILFSVSLNASGQLLMRKGMLKIGQISIDTSALLKVLPEMLGNTFLWLSFLCYCISILSWVVVLSKFEVSFAYPFSSIGYVISAVIGYFFMGESVSAMRIAGIVIICTGVVLIARS